MLFRSVPACGDNADASNKDGVKNMVGDLAGKGKELGTTLTGLAKTLTGITDGKTADGAKGQLSEMVGKIEKMGSGGLGKLTGMLSGGSEGIMKTVKDQITRLMGNADITKSIGPILTKLTGLLGK